MCIKSHKYFTSHLTSTGLDDSHDQLGLESHEGIVMEFCHDDEIDSQIEYDPIIDSEDIIEEVTVVDHVQQDMDVVDSYENRCCLCGKILESYENLQEHCFLEHSRRFSKNLDDLGIEKCPICLTKFQEKSVLQSHFSCNETGCFQILLGEDEILEHMLTVHKTEHHFHPGNDHIEDHNPEQSTDGNLKSIENKTLQRRYLNYKKWYPEGKYKRSYLPGFVYICHICQEEVRGYKTHMKTIHPEHPLEFKCHLCEKSYRLMNSLTSHFHNAHSDIKKKYTCDLCNKSFPRNAILEQHRLAIHFNIRNFECNICKMCFVRKSNLKAHLKTHLDLRDVGIV